MVDVRENSHEDPSLIVTGWRKKDEKTRGEKWEEETRDMEETILTRRSKDVARIRWTSQKKLYGGESGESDTMDSANTIMDVFYEKNIDLTNITGERGQSNVGDEIMQHAESDINVDSATAKEQRGEGVIRTTEESGEQSQAAAGEGLTPYIFLTLEELEKLRETIRKTLREID